MFKWMTSKEKPSQEDLTNFKNMKEFLSDTMEYLDSQ